MRSLGLRSAAVANYGTPDRRIPDATFNKLAVASRARRRAPPPRQRFTFIPFSIVRCRGSQRDPACSVLALCLCYQGNGCDEGREEYSFGDAHGYLRQGTESSILSSLRTIQQVASGNDYYLVVAPTSAIVFVAGGAPNLFSVRLKDQGCVSHPDRPAKGRQVVVGDMARHLVLTLLHQEANTIPPENRSLGCSGQRHCDPETPHHVEPAFLAAIA
jgi:hypothetical protein